MSPFEIVLIIVGIVCVIVSFFMTDKKSDTNDATELTHIAEQLSLKKLSDAGDELSRLQNKTISQTKEELAKVSNEKIMAVHEYSEQVLGSIEKSHQEVMFLYTMLTSKEDEMKETMKHLQATKHELERLCSTAKESTKESARDTSYFEVPQDTTNQELLEQEHLAQMFQSSKKETTNRSVKKVSNKKNKNLLEEDSNLLKSKTSKKESLDTTSYADHIDDVCRLADEGLTVAQISKQLGLGQGEVKLVLDFYKK